MAHQISALTNVSDEYPTHPKNRSHPDAYASIDTSDISLGLQSGRDDIVRGIETANCVQFDHRPACPRAPSRAAVEEFGGRSVVDRRKVDLVEELLKVCVPVRVGIRRAIGDVGVETMRGFPGVWHSVSVSVGVRR